MKVLKPFMDQFDTVLFDMDGVITSEQNYWDIAALTVFEMLHDESHYGTEEISPAWCLNHAKEIRDELFCGDRLITLMKERGVNSNWDLAYLTFAFLISKYAEDSEELLNKLYDSPEADAFVLYDMAQTALVDELGMAEEEAARSGDIWTTCQHVFQQWYLGDEEYKRQFSQKPYISGKTPMYKLEVPIIPVDDLHTLLSLLQRSGKRLGIATGRPRFEIEQPLRIWQVNSYFDKESCVNYTDIMDAEEVFRQKGKTVTLTKPHPYIFLKALYGRSYDDEKILQGDYDTNKLRRTLIVGDAGADILAAKAMGSPFAAVLTGVSGEAAKPYFEEQEAKFILDDIRDFMTEAGKEANK